jgi:hypothetical protein
MGLALFFVAAALVVTSSAQGANIVLQPNETDGADTFIYEGIPDANLDIVNAGPTFGRLLGVGQTNSGHTTESLLKFDLAGVGLTGAQVASATLRLVSVSSPFGVSPAGANPVLVDLFALAGPFSETEVTWGSADPPTPGPPATGALFSQLSIDATNQAFTFDVTNLVKDWLNGALTNNGMILKGNAPVVVGSTYAVAAFA